MSNKDIYVNKINFAHQLIYILRIFTMYYYNSGLDENSRSPERAWKVNCVFFHLLSVFRKLRLVKKHVVAFFWPGSVHGVQLSTPYMYNKFVYFNSKNGKD